MGAVYLAEHVDIERRVALKLVHAELLRNPMVLGQFRQEARAASRIGNPYICDVTDWGELPDGRVFFVMEYLDGSSLGRVLEQSAQAGARALHPHPAPGGQGPGRRAREGDRPPRREAGQRDAGRREDGADRRGEGGGLRRGRHATSAAPEAQLAVTGTPEYMAPERPPGRPTTTAATSTRWG